MNNWKKTLLLLGLSTTVLTAQTEDRPLWMRYPSISPDGKQIAFTYRGDIYRVSTEGGEAVRLTTHAGYDTRPIWSPDSRQIAFSSDRNHLGVNIYIMSAQGGSARQLTTHSGAEVPYAFAPDGESIIFKARIQDDARSTLFPGHNQPELYSVSVQGGRPERILGIPAEYAVMSADGKRILYQDLKGAENEWRKHHTSSITRDIVEYDRERGTFTYIVEHAGEDRNPLYSPDGSKIYFLSERDGKTMNVYEVARSGAVAPRALTSLAGEPVRFLSGAKTGELCFGYAGEIYTLRPGEAPRRVSISIRQDGDDTLREVQTRSSGMTSTAVSPDGKQIAFVIRGEVFVTSADYATTRWITSTSATEGGLTFGKDGRTLVYGSTRDGAWDLYEAKLTRREDANFANATTIAERKLLPEIKGEKAFPQFSPDGKEIAFVHERERLVVYNFASRTLRRVMPDGLLQNGVGALSYQWSPDGKWFALAYVARAHAPYSDIGIVRADGSGELINLTNSGYTDGSPRWAMEGNAIVYTTDRYGMRNHASWGSQDDVMMIFLNRAAYERYQQSEEERELSEQASKADKGDTPTTDAKKSKGKKGSTKPEDKPKKSVLIELDNIETRRVRLTPNSSDLADAVVSADGKKLYYLSAFEGRYDLWMLDLLTKKTPKLINKLNTARPWFGYSADGSHLFVLGSTAQRLDTKSDALKAVSYSANMKIDYAAEREAMYQDVVREEGLRFYRADMHGVDWYALCQEYRKYLPHISNNYDFAEMLSELLGELNVSHTGSGYRSPAMTAAEPTAELGLFISESRDEDGLLVDEVIVGGPFDRSTSRLRAGDRIMAIDGVRITAGMDYYPLLAGRAGKPLLVSYRSAEGGKLIDETIKPISVGKLSILLYQRWVRQRADLVERLSGGRLGYVHIPSMGDPSFREVYSEALGRYYGRKGIVIDIRHNGGGRLHEDIEVFFGSKLYLMQEVRGRDYCEMPSRRWNHASIMLMCEDDYSNAHGTPWVYKHTGLGKLVGMPVPGTMTSVNWVTLQDPSLYFGIPAVGYRTAEGTYLENAQLEPDIRVKLDPAKALEGVDTQLEVAVRTLLADLD